MAGTRTKSRGRSGKGKFTDVPDLLPSLFADPDGRGSRRWQEVFGKPAPDRRSDGGWLLAENGRGPPREE